MNGIISLTISANEFALLVKRFEKLEPFDVTIGPLDPRRFVISQLEYKAGIAMMTVMFQEIVPR